MEQQLLDALKEQDKVDYIKSLIAGLTPEQIEKLGFITITKAFNADKTTDNIQVAFNRIGDLGLDGGGNTLMSTKDVELETKQVVNADPTLSAKDNRLMSIASVIDQMAKFAVHLKDVYIPVLDKDNPTLKMDVSDTGRAAQMQVTHKTRAVASMEWFKDTQQFVFSLFDKTSGVVKATFEIKPDGKAYVGAKQVAVLDDITTPAAPTADGEYKLKIASGVATWVTI